MRHYVVDGAEHLCMSLGACQPTREWVNYLLGVISILVHCTCTFDMVDWMQVHFACACTLHKYFFEWACQPTREWVNYFLGVICMLVHCAQCTFTLEIIGFIQVQCTCTCTCTFEMIDWAQVHLWGVRWGHGMDWSLLRRSHFPGAGKT